MKKIKLLLLAMLVATSGFFSSCEKEEGGPSLDFFGGDFIDGNTTVPTGSTLNFKITASSETDMEYIEVEREDAVVWDEDIDNSSKNSYTVEITLTAPSNAGTYDYTFIIYDSDDEEIISKSIVITTVVAQQVASYSNIDMGGSEITTKGSYLDAESGTAYLGSQVDASPNVKNAIDIIFDNSKFSNTSNKTGATDAKFATTTITTAQFDAATTDFLFSQLTGNLDNISISANSVVFFQTKGGKKGLIKVKSMEASGKKDLAIAMKIQP